MVRLAFCTIAILTIGCSSLPKIDLAREISRTSGVEDAIVIRPSTDSPPTTEPAIDHLTASQALRLALHHDPRIQAAIARVRVAQAEAEQSRLLPNPILNLDVRFPEKGGSQVVEATLTGDLISVLEMPGRTKAADQRLRAAAAEMISTLLDVVAELQQGYAAAQSIDAQTTILESRLAIVQRLRDVAANRFKAGEGVRLDVLTLDAQLVDSELELADKRQQRAEARFALTRMIGDPRGQASWTLDTWDMPIGIHSSESAWIDTALANRPEIQAHVWELSALGEEVKLASLAPLEGGEVGAHGEHDQTWAIGPTITTPLPIFDFGQASRARAKASRDVAHHELAQQQSEVIEEIRGAFANQQSARTSLEATQNRLLPLLEQQRAQAEVAYRNGESDLTTLLLAQSSLQETQSKVIEMQEKMTTAMIHLQRAAGGASAVAKAEATTATTGPTP